MTRHPAAAAPDFWGVRPVSALVPGVLGTTGVESAEIVQSVVEATRPDRVVVVDALAAGSADRLCRVIQVTDAGIVPGSGVGNSRAAFFCRNPWRAGGGRRCAHGDGCPAAGGAGAPHGDASGCGCPGAPFVKLQFLQESTPPSFRTGAMTKLHNLSIYEGWGYVKQFCMSRGCAQGCGTVEKPVEIVQNFMLSTGQRRSPDFFRGNWVHKILNIHSLERVFPKLRRLLWKNLHGETPRKNWNFSLCGCRSRSFPGPDLWRQADFCRI